MKALEERIKKDGRVLPGNILNVNTFLNHQIDAPFMMEMGEEVARLFKEDKPTKILTIEASGIAIGFAVAAVMKLPLIFAKKNKSSNVDSDVYCSSVHSYTHNKDYTAVISKEILSADDRVLIVDDFLANGCALRGLIEIVEQSGATVVGCATAVEKGYQGGGDSLRREGVKVESLAIVESMSEEEIIFRV